MAATYAVPFPMNLPPIQHCGPVEHPQSLPPNQLPPATQGSSFSSPMYRLDLPSLDSLCDAAQSDPQWAVGNHDSHTLPLAPLNFLPGPVLPQPGQQHAAMGQQEHNLNTSFGQQGLQPRISEASVPSDLGSLAIPDIKHPPVNRPPMWDSSMDSTPQTASSGTPVSSPEQTVDGVVEPDDKINGLPGTAREPYVPPVPTCGYSKYAIQPVRDETGKFPCPYCPKTYLHAKHLKRHMVRRK